VEFLVISIFHETKIRTVDMKVQVYHDQALIAGCRPRVGSPGPASDQRLPTGRRSTPGQGRLAPFKFFIFFLLPSTLCASSQLLMVGSMPALPKVYLKTSNTHNF
jgi:hypothetical protein